MTRIRFHQSLGDLKDKLLVMAGMAEQAIQRAIEAYRERDLRFCDLVLRGEVAINRLEREIDQMALDLLAMEQPMAIDLRFILAVIKINADLERVGDQAVNITNACAICKHFRRPICRSIFRAWPQSRPPWSARHSSPSSRRMRRWPPSSCHGRQCRPAERLRLLRSFEPDSREAGVCAAGIARVDDRPQP